MQKEGSEPFGTLPMEEINGRCYHFLRDHILPGPHANCFPCTISFHNHNSVKLKVLPPFYRTRLNKKNKILQNRQGLWCHLPSVKQLGGSASRVHDHLS